MQLISLVEVVCIVFVNRKALHVFLYKVSSGGHQQTLLGEGSLQLYVLAVCFFVRSVLALLWMVGVLSWVRC